MEPDMILLETEEAMTKVVDYVVHEFGAVRTGKASPGLVENLDVHVRSYGMNMKLKQLASISTPEPRVIRVEPFDGSTLQDIDRAFRESRLGLNPVVESKDPPHSYPRALPGTPCSNGEAGQGHG